MYENGQHLFEIGQMLYTSLGKSHRIILAYFLLIKIGGVERYIEDSFTALHLISEKSAKEEFSD